MDTDEGMKGARELQVLKLQVDSEEGGRGGGGRKPEAVWGWA